MGSLHARCSCGSSLCATRRLTVCVGWLVLAVFILESTPFAGRPALACEIEIGQPQGAVLKGLVDGFPGLAPLDGAADFPQSTLAVALQNGVTEARVVGEFPLSPLVAACVDAAAVLGARLRFNIDDVLSTFGPGTAFDGTAAGVLLLHPFLGDGQVTLGDFRNTAAAPKVVDTTTHGTITDATLAQTGPLFFEADLTQEIRASLGAASHAGVLWRTTDSPTGTSIDDLGDAGAGPPGVNGARPPHLIVTLGNHATDLQCAGEVTVCRWHREPGEVSYDVIRGDVTSLAAEGGQVDLGPVICIEEDSANTSTEGLEDPSVPEPGRAFFYLVRSFDGARNLTYGHSSSCETRVPWTGDCG